MILLICYLLIQFISNSLTCALIQGTAKKLYWKYDVAYKKVNLPWYHWVLPYGFMHLWHFYRMSRFLRDFNNMSIEYSFCWWPGNWWPGKRHIELPNNTLIATDMVFLWGLANVYYWDMADQLGILFVVTMTLAILMRLNHIISGKIIVVTIIMLFTTFHLAKAQSSTDFYRNYYEQTLPVSSIKYPDGSLWTHPNFDEECFNELWSPPAHQGLPTVINNSLFYPRTGTLVHYDSIYPIKAAVKQKKAPVTNDELYKRLQSSPPLEVLGLMIEPSGAPFIRVAYGEHIYSCMLNSPGFVRDDEKVCYTIAGIDLPTLYNALVELCFQRWE